MSNFEQLNEDKFKPFLAPFEQKKVWDKYENMPFLELFDDLKANTNDAILFIMDKYDPLLNSIWMKWYSNTRQGKKDLDVPIRIEDWKNEVYMYLSGAGMSQPFFNKFNPPGESSSEEYLWKSFSMYLKYYLNYYFNKLLHAQHKQSIAQYSLNAPIKNDEDSTEKIEKVASKTSDDETIQVLFDKYMLLLKEYYTKYKRRKTMYQAVKLRVENHSFKEIATILKISLFAVYKTVARAKERWLKFLESHKTAKKLPEKLEKKEISVTPIQE